MHDKNGTPIAKGSRVIVEFIVEDTSATEEYCNVRLKTVEPFYPDFNRFDSFWFNAKQTIAQP